MKVSNLKYVIKLNEINLEIFVFNQKINGLEKREVYQLRYIVNFQSKIENYNKVFFFFDDDFVIDELLDLFIFLYIFIVGF